MCYADLIMVVIHFFLGYAQLGLELKCHEWKYLCTIGREEDESSLLSVFTLKSLQKCICITIWL